MTSDGLSGSDAAAGASALLRFNSDTDLDGYSDRTEQRLGTDPNDPADHPAPELLAGLHEVHNGDEVVATLSLLNTGLYDAYGVEAVMVAPDDTVTITNNTVGGSGRVKATKSVVVGSSIGAPTYDSATWGGSATPSVSGYYTGDGDRTYAFAVGCSQPGGCDVSDGAWTLAWADDQGASGTLDFSSGYASPTPLAVGEGLMLALVSGSVENGDAFTVAARTPRDTFQYTVNAETYTAPIVIVSYNDPQGNHRFVTPVVVQSGTPSAPTSAASA